MNHLYRHFDKEGKLLYVGISLSAINRLGQHKEHSHWFEKIASVTIENIPTREELLVAERNAVKNETPLYNIHHKRTERQLRLEQAQSAQSQFAIEDAKKSKERIIHQTVNVAIVYNIVGLADVLGIRPIDAFRIVEAGEIGFFNVAVGSEKNPKVETLITGWQLIDYLEHKTKETA